MTSRRLLLAMLPVTMALGPIECEAQCSAQQLSALQNALAANDIMPGNLDAIMNSVQQGLPEEPPEKLPNPTVGDMIFITLLLLGALIAYEKPEYEPIIKELIRGTPPPPPTTPSPPQRPTGPPAP